MSYSPKVTPSQRRVRIWPSLSSSRITQPWGARKIQDLVYGGLRIGEGGPITQPVGSKGTGKLFPIRVLKAQRSGAAGILDGTSPLERPFHRRGIAGIGICIAAGIRTEQ